MSFRRPFRLPIFLVVCIAVLGLSAPASAGTISLAWDPVSHPDLVGYRVYYSQTAGNYGPTTDVGLTPEVTLSGLADCTTHYVAVKARGSDGSESPQFSAEISGWARPEVLSVSPSSVDRNTQVNLTIAGTNFQSGATIQLSNPGVTVNSVSVNGCSQLVANVSIGTTAALGDVDVEVINPDQVFGAGAALFSVTPDSAPPSIFSVQAVNVGSTAATISWSTDEPADSQVFYRRAGESVYQQTSLDATLVTQHQIDLTGLSPDSTYEYHVRSADSAGNVSTSSPDQTFVTSSSSFSYLRIEAESGALASPVGVTSGAGAFRGAWIATPPGTSQGNANSPAGTASIGFNLENSASWHFWYRIYGPGTNNNSWYEEVDGGGMGQITTTQNGAWQWIAGRSYSLNAGLHTLTLGGRESEARVDRVLITDDPGFVPTEQPGADVTPPAQVSALGAAPSDGANSLSWNNPGSADLDRVVVRFRTDGSHPQTPLDGLPLFDQPATPNVAESLVHSGLTNGTTYYYSVFAVDAVGNASNPSTIQSTPDIETPPLGQVQNVHRTDTAGP
jgi:chitodextrinase